MTKKEYIVDEPFELTATPISWLEGMPKEELSSDDILLVVSQPNYQVQDTGYISKKAKLADLKDALAESLSASILQQEIDSISAQLTAAIDIKDKLEALLPTQTVSADGSASDPYILSSITAGYGNLSSAGGYRLKDALSAILPANEYSMLKGATVSCTTLNVNGSEIEGIGHASAAQYGTVKIDNSKATTAAKSYVKMELAGADAGKLFVDIQGIQSRIAESIVPTVSAQVLAAVQQQYFKTVVSQQIPSTLAPNTIYYVINPPEQTT